jgi:DNA-binding transcriptional ArsR family regulator
MHPKTEAFEPGLQELSLFAKSLAHPARMAIIELLARRKSCYSGDIAQELPLQRSTVAQHLQELKKLGLIKGSIEGQYVNYCLNPDVLRHYTQSLEQWLTQIKLEQSENRIDHNNCWT